MDKILICTGLALFGLMLGSFAGATVWRLRARQLVADKKEGEPVDKKEYKQLLPLAKASVADDRSRCLHCGHLLAWYDLLPLISWASTRGKCRYCQQPIGWLEPLIELGVAAFFVVSFLVWPSMLHTQLEITQFILWLAAGVVLAILFAYDLKWFLLPNPAVFTLLGIGVLVALLHVIASADKLAALVSLAAAAAILSGLYLALWLVSKGQWIGLGDVKLGLALALLLGRWELAFIALFSANLIGCIIVLPAMLRGKVTRKTHVPFGPLLIAGAVLAMLAGPAIVDWYFAIYL